MAVEKLSVSPAASARSLMWLCRRSSSNGRLWSSVPRSYISSGRWPFAISFQENGTLPPASITRWRIVVVQFVVSALYQAGFCARSLIALK